MATLKTGFAHDRFNLYKVTIRGVSVDSFLMVFAEPPKTVARTVRFIGTDYRERGQWASSIVAVGDLCPISIFYLYMLSIFLII